MIEDKEVLRLLELEASRGSIAIDGLNVRYRQWEMPPSVLAPHRLANQAINLGEAAFALWMRKLQAAGQGTKNLISLQEMSWYRQATELSRFIPPQLEPSERARLLREALDKTGVPWTSWHLDEPADDSTVADRLAQALEQVRQRGKSPGFRKRAAQRRKEALRNASRARESLKGLLGRSRGCQVLRVNARIQKPIGEPDVDLQQLSAHFSRYRNGWRKYSFYKELKGYLWRVQFSVDGGYYHHLVCIAKPTEPYEALFEGMREAWYRASDKAGSMQDCALADPIYSAGCGLWDRSSRAELKSALISSVMYLFQRDEYLKPVVAARQKIWDHTERVDKTPKKPEPRSLSNLRIQSPWRF
jgi:hypothetical protein